MDEKKTPSQAPGRAPAQAASAASQASENIFHKSGATRPGQFRPSGLTAREYETARLAAEGLYNQEIAERLGVSVNTVKTHLRKAYRKYGVSSRPDLRKIMKK
ncbi:hypothetical protein KL86DPRO_20540 [uncultured delta proteobacterium]|uniref:HTH luxR-type domain-containing protein n=1 Tax=uncultured delta proteobacterium TaxID=34034 RepID=A0A212K2J1_9DELT|nr:hypothetical protein KL86DPRO_20540 [uncultured delta proteobacterium]